MADYPPTLINIINGELIDKLDKVNDKIQNDMSTGYSKDDSLKISVLTSHDKNKSHL